MSGNSCQIITLLLTLFNLTCQRNHHMIQNDLMNIPIHFANVSKLMTINGVLGNNNYLQFTLDISSNVSWVNKTVLHGFENINTGKRRSYKPTGTKRIAIEGIEYTGLFGLVEAISIPNFNFILADKIHKSNRFTAVLGLARNFADPKENFIKELYRQGKILYPVFSIVYYGIDPMLQIGTIIDGIIEYPEFVFYAYSPSIDEKWRLGLKGIFFGELGQDFIQNIDPSKNQYRISNVLYEINSSAELSTTDKSIVVPYDFMIYLEKYYFKGRYCTLITKLNISIFRCDPKYTKEIEALGNINIVLIENIALTFHPKELYDFNRKGIMTFAFINLKYYEGHWVFGYFFMRKYHLTFNYIKDQLTIFSLTDKHYVIVPKYHGNQRFIFIILSIFLCSGISILYIHSKKSNFSGKN